MDLVTNFGSHFLLATRAHDFDSVLSEVGDYGKYQLIWFFILCMPASLPSAFSAFNQPFVVGMPQHRCKVPEGREDLTPVGVEEEVMSCFQYNQSQVDHYRNFTSIGMDVYREDLELVPCQNGWVYDNTTYVNSLVTEFDLVCGESHWVEISTTSFYVGSFIGNAMFGWVADKFGRRRSFFLILACLVCFGSLNSLVRDVREFVAVRFLVGLPFPALFQIPFIITMELMGNEGRIFSGLMINMFFGAAMGVLGVVAMLIRRWRELILASNLPFAVLFVYYFFLPESPRWLVSVGRFDEAKAILERIAKTNGRGNVDVEELVEQLRIQAEISSEAAHSRDRHASTRSRRSMRDGGEEKRSHNVTDLFRTPNLRKKTIIVTYIWVMNAIIYNGLTLNATSLPVDDYVSFIISGAIELPAYFIVWPLLRVIGRRWTLASALFVCGVGCVSVMFCPEDRPWLIASMSFLGKFGVGSSFACIYIFAGELYPTVVRAIGMGMSSMVAGMGLLLAPHIVALGTYWRILPLLIMGTMALSAGLLTFLLPETRGAPLPMTIEDAEMFGKPRAPGTGLLSTAAVSTAAAAHRKSHDHLRESSMLLAPAMKERSQSAAL